MNLTQAQRAFLNWLRSYDSAMYEIAMVKLQSAYTAPNVGTLGAYEPMGPPATLANKSAWDSFTDSLMSGFNTIKNTAAKVMPVYDRYKTSRATVKSQLDRAKRGLPPVATAPANPNQLSSEQIRGLKYIAAITEQKRRASEKGSFNITMTPMGERVAAVLPWAGAGFLLWAVTRKKTAR